jgi:hypothetical protein
LKKRDRKSNSAESKMQFLLLLLHGVLRQVTVLLSYARKPAVYNNRPLATLGDVVVGGYVKPEENY